jgi:drug/metabolite transporter (DMT)-like permease
VSDSKRRRLAFLALAAAGSLWGTGFLLGKIALAAMGVGHMILYRFVFASLALVPLVAHQRPRPPRRADLGRIVVAGALYVPIQFIIQFEGLARTTVSHASLMVGALPILIAAAAVVFMHESLDRTGWLTLVASTVGVALIVGSGAHGGQASVGGDLLVLLSLLASIVWLLMSKRLMRDDGYSAVAATAYVMFAGTALLAVWVLLVDGRPPTALPAYAWASVIGSGVFVTAATTMLWNWGLTVVPATQAGIFLNLEPAVGALLGVTLLNERLGAVAMLGGALIVGTAIMFTRRDSVSV